MLFLQRNLNLINKRRTLRALYAQTQAYPYAVTLDAAFTRTQGQLGGGSWTAISGAQAAIYPGSVAVKQAGEQVTLAPDSYGSSQRAFGLFNDFVGGILDQLGSGTGSQSQSNLVGVWRGAGGVFEILAPVFGTITGAAADAGTVSTEVYMNPPASTSSGILSTVTAGANVINNTARLVQSLSANAIVVELLV